MHAGRRTAPPTLPKRAPQRSIGNFSDLPTILHRAFEQAFLIAQVRTSQILANDDDRHRNRRQVGIFAITNVEISKIVGKSEFLPAYRLDEQWMPA